MWDSGSQLDKRRISFYRASRFREDLLISQALEQSPHGDHTHRSTCVHLSRDCKTARCAQRYQEHRSSRTQVGSMSTRSPISVDIKHRQYTGEYEISGGVLYVFYEGRSKSSVVIDPSPELLARLLLIEMVFQAPSWRDHRSSELIPHVSRQG